MVAMIDLRVDFDFATLLIILAVLVTLAVWRMRRKPAWLGRRKLIRTAPSMVPHGRKLADMSDRRRTAASSDAEMGAGRG